MKVAIMQPYIFPYLGYFQLLFSVDTFVFYDDVNYIKGGWVNRNRILVNNTDKFLTIPCDKASPNKLISEINLIEEHPLFRKQLQTIEQSYKKAPMFEDVFPIIESIFKERPQKLSDFAILSIKSILDYLGIKKNILKSSEHFTNTKGLERTQRLLTICNRLNTSIYINPVGGKALYKKEDFKEKNIELLFLNPNLPKYEQFNKPFIPGLSIIDVVMFNDITTIKYFLDSYSLL